VPPPAKTKITDSTAAAATTAAAAAATRPALKRGLCTVLAGTSGHAAGTSASLPSGVVGSGPAPSAGPGLSGVAGLSSDEPGRPAAIPTAVARRPASASWNADSISAASP
jgi:hypothetical protein